MQNCDIENAVPWNPWHGCKKVSPGCKNCFVYKMDKRYGRDTTIIIKGEQNTSRWVSGAFKKCGKRLSAIS